MGTAEFLPLINKAESYKLRVCEISTIIRKNRLIEVNTDHGSYITYDKMDNVLRYLDDYFVRYRDGGAINIKKIDYIENMRIYLDNGEIIKPGRDGFVKIKQRFNAYLLELPYNR